MRLVAAALASALLLAGCAAPVDHGRAGAEAYPVPPPLPAELRPLPPVSDQILVWRPGDWVFIGGSYRYESGGYEPAAGHAKGQGANWMFGHWTGLRGQYVWVPGGWV